MDGSQFVRQTVEDTFAKPPWFDKLVGRTVQNLLQTRLDVHSHWWLKPRRWRHLRNTF